MSLFELSDFAPPAPDWAEACMYCSPADDGYYDEARHLGDHLPLTCSVCGGVSPNRLLFEMSHCVNLGASWSANALLCSSLALRLNHLLYDTLHDETPDARDATALDLGWTVDVDGFHAPEGWPDGSHAVKCEAVPEKATLNSELEVARCVCGHADVEHHGVDRNPVHGGCFGEGSGQVRPKCSCTLTCADVRAAS